MATTMQSNPGHTWYCTLLSTADPSNPPSWSWPQTGRSRHGVSTSGTRRRWGLQSRPYTTFRLKVSPRGCMTLPLFVCCSAPSRCPAQTPALHCYRTISIFVDVPGLKRRTLQSTFRRRRMRRNDHHLQLSRWPWAPVVTPSIWPISFRLRRKPRPCLTTQRQDDGSLADVHCGNPLGGGKYCVVAHTARVSWGGPTAQTPRLDGAPSPTARFKHNSQHALPGNGQCRVQLSRPLLFQRDCQRPKDDSDCPSQVRRVGTLQSPQHCVNGFQEPAIILRHPQKKNAL